MEVRYSGVNNKTITPIPIPKPIPNKNKYDLSFEKLWNQLEIKRGSKFKAFKEFAKINGSIGLSIEDLIKIYQDFISSSNYNESELNNLINNLKI